MLKLSRLQKIALGNLLTDFPEFPPLLMTREGVRKMYLQVLLFSTKKELHTLQFQAGLSHIYASAK